MKRYSIISIIMFCAVIVSARTFTLRNGEDGYTGAVETYIRQNDSNSNFGDVNLVYVRNDNIHGLIKFDLSNLTGVIQTVTNATLTLYDYSLQSGTNNVVFHRLLKDWVETEATYNIYASGQLWETAGAFGTTDRGAAFATNEMLVGGGTYDISLSADLVQDWIDHPATNFGIIMDAIDNVTVAFASSENSTIAWRPMLTIGATINETITNSFRQGVDGYSGADDTYIRQGYPDTKYGAGADMFIRSDGMLGLFRFDLSSLSGQVENVVEATLTLYDNSGEAVATNPAIMYRMLKNWDEADATYNEYASGSTWETAGAAGASDRGSAITTVGLSVGTHTNFDVGIPVDLVQDWIDHPSTNYGIILEATLGNTVLLDCSEHGTVNLRPMLTIEYVPMPPCGTVIMVK